MPSAVFQVVIVCPGYPGTQPFNQPTTCVCCWLRKANPENPKALDHRDFYHVMTTIMKHIRVFPPTNMGFSPPKLMVWKFHGKPVISRHIKTNGFGGVPPLIFGLTPIFKNIPTNAIKLHMCTPTHHQVVVSTHLKNMLVILDHLPR